MPSLKLSLLSLILGLGFALPQVYGVMNPAAFGQLLKKFPRYTPVGYFLMLLGTGWFLFYLSKESVSDFVAFKPALYAFFGLVGVGACFYVKDFLPVRGLAVVLLLLAKLMVDTARWEDTGWRLVISAWAYLFVVLGIWFTVSPWRLRDMITWETASEQRVRMLSGLRLLFGLMVVILGVTVFRSVEKKDAVSLPSQSPRTASASHPAQRV